MINKKSKYIIHYKNKHKLLWDQLMGLLLLFVAIVLPYRTAFDSDDEPDMGWSITYSIINILFLFDVVITFFTVYKDEKGNRVVNLK